MEVLLNDLSLHGQFANVHAFQDAFQAIIDIRNRMAQFERKLYCHRNVAQAQVTHNLTLQQAVWRFDLNKRRAVLGWLTRHGPFWEDDRSHGPDEYLECQGRVVTDTALGEAAFHCFKGSKYQLVSLAPSDWMFTPIPVVWQHDNVANIEVPNHWEIGTLESVLRTASSPIQSWEQLASIMLTRCTNLTFTNNSFESLRGHPFVNSAAQRIVELLETLDKYKSCFGAQGQRTAEGQGIYQDHFTGDKAWFTDSSESEKNEFKANLTFNHPDKENETLFCTWHAKIKTPQFRIHFSSPICASDPLYVVYIGPKITKR